ncbi:MAG: hypothetical protein QME50_07500 [Candidatus Bathyarchaeota archaeon]|nr:hypothetical protein [Candidatus Bathyarchaeota archaeon]
MPPPKGRTKYSVIAILGMMVWIPLTGLLAPVLGPVGLIFILIGFIIWAFGLRQTWGAVRHAPSSNKEALERRAPETPKSFMKKCVKCGREIPIASEQCPFCGQTQP